MIGISLNIFHHIPQDPLNLQGKLQKHQAFVLELNANESRIEGVQNKGKELIDAQHYEKENNFYYPMA